MLSKYFAEAAMYKESLGSMGEAAWFMQNIKAQEQHEVKLKSKKGKLKTLWRALNCQHIFQHVGSGDALAIFALVKYIGFIMISVIHMYRDKVLDLYNSCGNKNED